MIIALIFLNYFAIIFGQESRLRKEALDKLEEVIAKEQQLVSLGGQAAAAAHSLNTPLSTIKIISQDLSSQFKDKKDIKKRIHYSNKSLSSFEFDRWEHIDFLASDLSYCPIKKPLISYK